MRFIFVFGHSVMEWKGNLGDLKIYLIPYDLPGPIPDVEMRRKVRERVQPLYQNVRHGQKKIHSSEVVDAMMAIAEDAGRPFWYDTSADTLDGVEVPEFFRQFLGLGLLERMLRQDRGWKF